MTPEILGVLLQYGTREVALYVHDSNSPPEIINYGSLFFYVGGLPRLRTVNLEAVKLFPYTLTGDSAGLLQPELGWCLFPKREQN